MIGSDFQPEVMAKICRCSECGRKLDVGTSALVSRKRGKVKKRVCSEECRKTFDFNYWQHIADLREKRNEHETF